MSEPAYRGTAQYPGQDLVSGNTGQESLASQWYNIFFFNKLLKISAKIWIYKIPYNIMCVLFSSFVLVLLSMF